jgi:aspartyl-tRNA synthetase
MHRYRTHTCGALRESDIGRPSGCPAGATAHPRPRRRAVHRPARPLRADPGGRRSGQPGLQDAEKLRSPNGWCGSTARCARRPAGTENPDLPTGQVEVFATEIEVLGPAAELPMPVFGDQEYPEDIRLRTASSTCAASAPARQHHEARQIIDSIRRRMKEGGFFEFQTPILTASSPEGARDYLVPSRLHPGKFYALPQAPQQFKQLIMVSGFDRYFQIAPCFRDEDARADRSPGEFYQLDIEMSFVTQDDVFNAVEPVLRGVFEEFADGKPVTPKFPRIPYADAMRNTAPTSRTCATRSRCRNVTEPSAVRASRFSPT